MSGLSNGEIMRVVNRWIGGEGGYLGDFSYRTHADFYSTYCDLDIDPYKFQGTTRERFIQIVGAASPHDQAKIIRGVLDRFPIGDRKAPESRTESLRHELLELAERLERGAAVASPRATSAVVERALSDAETLIKAHGPTSAVDRVHTALHGYLQAACDDSAIPYPSEAGTTALFKLLRERHTGLQDLGPRAQDITRVLTSMATILDALNPVRNRASAAHPNRQLLGEPEAVLVINTVRTLLHYLDARLEN